MVPRSFIAVTSGRAWHYQFGGLLASLAVFGVLAPSIGVGSAPMALIGMVLYENAYVQAGQSVPLA